MAQRSSIEWTESTWNPVTGCDRISHGCDQCYAERMAFRLQAMGSKRYQNAFDLTVHHDLLEVPLRWKEPRTIFVNSMSDLFHEQVPGVVIRKIFATMNAASWHTFQVLTKRPMELLRHAEALTWTPNIWMGVTVESYRYIHRIEALRMVPAQSGSFRSSRSFRLSRWKPPSRGSTGRLSEASQVLAPTHEEGVGD